MLLLAGMLSFSFVATSCGDDDDDPVEQVQEFTITYDANGGSGTVAPTKFKPGAQITLSDGSGLTAPEGKVFAGWSTSKDKEELDVTKITGNTTLYAVWKDAEAPDAEKVTITFDLDGGTSAAPLTNIDVEKGTEVKAADYAAFAPTKEGYTFKGWTTEKGGTTPMESVTVTEASTLYAIWEKNAEEPNSDPATTEAVDLTADGFSSWSDYVNGVILDAAPCALKIGEASDLPYGDGSVINYIDLSAYKELIVVASEGEPRFLLNRNEKDGQDPDHLINIPNNPDQTDAYETMIDNGDGTKTYSINLARVIEEWGYAHLHAIKGAGAYGSTVTVVSLQVRK